MIEGRSRSFAKHFFLRFYLAIIGYLLYDNYMKRIGRPKKPKAEILSEKIVFCCRVEERQTMEVAAKKEQLYLSEWIRKVVLSASIK